MDGLLHVNEPHRFLEDTYVSQMMHNVTDFLDSHKANTTLHPASDVTVNAVISSVYFNSIIFCFLITTYECLRRKFPYIYNGRHHHVASNRLIPFTLPKGWLPFQWMIFVLNIPWRHVRECCGLDAYFFLRYIRMCLRITFVTGVWGAIILWPTYALGGGGASGWYHISMANLQQQAKSLWVPTVFMWVFSFYVFYTMNKEYLHYLDLRMEFLGKGDPSVHPQHHYSILVEKIPDELQSDVALFEYFDSLFPGKVHSASVVLKLPDLETLSARRNRVIHRLEKSVAYYEAAGIRPTHRVGQPRLMCCGVQTEPIDLCTCLMSKKVSEDEDPSRGTLVDSIKYYSKELCQINKDIFSLQVKKLSLSRSGSNTATNWMSIIKNKIPKWSQLGSSSSLEREQKEKDRKNLDSEAERRKKKKTYGALTVMEEDEKSKPLIPQSNPESLIPILDNEEIDEKPMPLFPLSNSKSQSQNLIRNEESSMTHSKEIKQVSAPQSDSRTVADFNYELYHTTDVSIHEIAEHPFSQDNSLGAAADNLGMDFVRDCCNKVGENIEKMINDAIGTTMSSTGFVTFSNLATATCASTAFLTDKAGALEASVAPEPRDIEWANAHLHVDFISQRRFMTSLIFVLGAIVWSVPLTLIQAFATAESLAKIPGMAWLLNSYGGTLKAFINGYLPVVALLVLIMLLPIIFEFVAKNVDHCKTFSGVQNAILTRYFYYQLANIYITVTAGSLWTSLSRIIDNPSELLEILGKSLPTVVGYFVSLLLTKILAGLPIVLLRSGALLRMLFLRGVFTTKFLTQRELDEVYRPQYLLFGWEYPTQLLVVVICFTYACISPIILPFGVGYFGFALIIYKKQVLYLYTPRYENGGESFPLAMQRTLIGLICGQVTFMGYMTLRQVKYQPLSIMPLVLMTFYMMSNFEMKYVRPSRSLSLERATAIDEQHVFNHVTPFDNSTNQTICSSFSTNAYQQPVLNEGIGEPLPYRHGVEDKLKSEIDNLLGLESRKRIESWGKQLLSRRSAQRGV